MRTILNFLTYCSLFLYLTSCETIVVSEAISKGYLDKQEQAIEQKGNKVFEYHDLLGKKVAFLSYVKEEKAISKDLLEEIKGKVFQRGTETEFFNSYISEVEVRQRLKNDQIIRQASQIYLDSLVTVAVSDKDLSSIIGDYLEVDSFLVFQVDLWPCSSCVSKDIMSIKLRLVESENGSIVWTGISQKSEVPQEEKELELTLHGLTDEVLDLFYNRFKSKWHVNRFESLKK
ncbi:MAG: hypothetical protein GY786_05880 [Proteobacteria bacterium]|nr:hypothetical protein [Pseudomonadota bacterium]